MIKFPWQRAIRTFLQVVAAVVLFIAGTVAFLQVFLPQLLDALREVLPPSWYAWGIGAIATIGVIASTLARVMAIPAVDRFLKRFGAGSVPRSEPLPLPDPATSTRSQYQDALDNSED